MTFDNFRVEYDGTMCMMKVSMVNLTGVTNVKCFQMMRTFNDWPCFEGLRNVLD